MDKLVRRHNPMWTRVLFSWHGMTLLLWVALLALGVVLALAVWAWTRPIVSTVPAPSIVNERLLIADSEPSTADHPFMASTIKAVYHRAGCRYAASIEHARHYANHEEAQADGKVPCKVCLPIVEVARGH